MITAVENLAIGNALRINYDAPTGLYARLLRRPDANFGGPSDPGATVVLDNIPDNYGPVVDAGVINGQPVFYALYSYDGMSWTATPAFGPAVPNATYGDTAVDPQELVRSRIELGLAVEVARGNLIPASGSIVVMTAPVALANSVKFPVVSVHMESTAPQHRGIGEAMLGDMYEPGGIGEDYVENVGWLSRMSLQIVAVSLNPDERIVLRKAIGRIFRGNLEVFASAGMVTIDFSQSDSEQFIENNAPLYMTTGSMSFNWPDVLLNDVAPITSVDVAVAPFGVTT